jgi:hypothetical protein
MQNILSHRGVPPVNGCRYNSLLRSVAERPSQNFARSEAAVVGLAMRVSVI